jgi:hypothetical protein
VNKTTLGASVAALGLGRVLLRTLERRRAVQFDVELSLRLRRVTPEARHA